MHLEKIILSNFRCFNENETQILLEEDLSCFVGNNGSGKTTLIVALKRLFGSSREDRYITRDDFYLAPNEDHKSINGRELYLEVIFSFPELEGRVEKVHEVCPAFYPVIYADEEDGKLQARMRLEAQWEDTEYEDEVQSKIYWITTSQKVEFGESSDFKFPVSSHDRKHIKLRYVPAFRDSKAMLKNEVRVLTKTLEDYTEISSESENKIETHSKNLSDEIQKLTAIEITTGILKDIWSQIHDETLAHYQNPKLEATPTKIGELLRSISIKLSPSEDGGSRDISELSDGQISLLYFTLAIALYDIEQKHHAGKAEGFKTLDRDIPVFTIFAFEEPENHLSPYYLGKVLQTLQTKTKTLKATGIITSHSSSVVRRMDRVEQIRYFRQDTISDHRHSVVKSILLPSKKTEEDYKYINQAVLAHPELYFSKLVLLGEGDSEKIIIPQLAKKLGFDLDPSFVSFIKLGGRHVNHMWRLLSDLELPFMTLLDMDLGRSGAGPARIKYAIDELKKIEKKFSSPSGITAEDIEQQSLTFKTLEPFAIELEDSDVFYSYPLDLDMAMIRSFPGQYNASNARESQRTDLVRTVLGEAHEDDNKYNDNDCKTYSDEELKKYRHLFCTKSKVSSHYQAMAEIVQLEDNDVKDKCPDFITRLIKKSSKLLKRGEDE